MKNKIMILGALMLMMSVTSCHKDSDVMLSYVYNDEMAFNAASQSYAEKFKVFWKAMNSTYSLWDYEKECGLDWDEHYRVMLPKFEELDNEIFVTDSILQNVMSEMVAPLHDGHMKVVFQNHATGHFVDVSPNEIRNRQRKDFNSITFVPNLEPYYERNELLDWKEMDTYASHQYRRVMGTKGIGLMWAQARRDELLAKVNPTEKDATTLYHLSSLIIKLNELQKKYTKFSKQTIVDYNALVAQYSFLNVQYLEPINTNFADCGITVKYGLFKDNIAYFYLSEFSLTPYMTDDSVQNTFSDTKHSLELARLVKEVYGAWFDIIQDLHKEKKLKGVIIDLRSNTGGMVSDAYYVLGSLLPQGGLQYGYSRFKRGSGRYDYSPYMPATSLTMQDNHEIIDDVPITILTNCWSVSMSEATSLSAKQLPNARLIGTRTWGGVCMLTDETDFSINYAGHIGVKNVTPVFVTLPMVGVFDMNKQSVEGKGIEPDIEVELDNALLKTGHDTQLDRALQYIRTGN